MGSQFFGSVNKTEGREGGTGRKETKFQQRENELLAVAAKMQALL